ncbi:MAG TPA: hypothetical protein VNX01_03900 [Bacteroidia bacterium]|jgi:hypothetical protein|nr:hypothetical protein [Bacteroidia bacterium]
MTRGIKFNISTPVNAQFKSMLRSIENYDKWKSVELETGRSFRKCEVGAVKYKMTDLPHELRIVIGRELTSSTRNNREDAEDKQRREMVEGKLKVLAKKGKLKKQDRKYSDGEWKPYKDYKLKLLITNDFVKAPDRLILEYYKRGNAERKFDAMKNNFAWNLPPFSRMNENTVFMIMAAIANNVFRAMLTKFADKIKQLKKTFRLKEFIDVFIKAECEIIKNTYVFANTQIEFEKLME